VKNNFLTVTTIGEILNLDQKAIRAENISDTFKKKNNYEHLVHRIHMRNFVLIFSASAFFSISMQALASNLEINAVCFAHPFDGKPENRLNVLPQLNEVHLLHVAEDFKTLKSSPKLIKINKSKQIENFTTHSLADGSVIAINFKTKQGIYYKNLEKAEGGSVYSCQVVRLSN